MKKGKLIGRGMTAEVYEWGPDKVLKLYYHRIGEEWIKQEARIGMAVHEAGVPSPTVFEIIDLDGRKGVIFQKISGSTMLMHFITEPWNLNHYAKQLADLQFRIHQFSANNLPSQQEKYEFRIKCSAKILGDKEQLIIDYLKSLPDGNSVCHGDLHFNNIIISGNNPVPIDWTNAYQGNPMSDLARTYLMMTSPAKPPLIPDVVTMPMQYVKWSSYRAYLNEYLMLSGASSKDIDAWILPTAAAKLKDRMPGEEKWLMGIINRRIMLL
ncbi:MAG: aminoglycoside phosphotransferase family protein [Clostridiaceae bacterium]